MATFSRTDSNDKPIVVGLYGVPGCGKTYILNQLKEELGQEQFSFYDGSEMLSKVVPGGLDAFQSMEEQDKVHWRQQAINAIGKECSDNKKVGVVAGHLMFWSEGQEEGRTVYTINDLEIYTHFLYLDIPAEVVVQRRLNDTKKDRPSMSVASIKKWQEKEKIQLKRLSRQYGILFSILPSVKILERIAVLLRDFQHHSEATSLASAESGLDEVITASQDQLKTMLVMDADKTLTAEDTGELFWRIFSKSRSLAGAESSLKDLFDSPLGYSYTAFRQAVLLYEEAANDQEFDDLCREVASVVTVRPDFVSLLHFVADQNHIGAIIITSGLYRIWEKVLEREGLSGSVNVIGGGRIANGFVVTAKVKGALVARLQKTHKLYVWAFGDSPLDLEMLSMADRAVVVVGEESTRSKSMDAVLTTAIEQNGLQAHQVLLPSNASPRLDVIRLPVIGLTEPAFVKSLLGDNFQTRLEVFCASNRNPNAAKLLATPMRDASITGPDLREAHRRVGHFLAVEFVTEMVGLEQTLVQHVLGRPTTGYRLLHEHQTTILALMRGGEPMALGVNDAFPRAMFVHTNNPNALKPHHLQGQYMVILVDSVINTGKSIIEFVQHVRKLHATIRIVIVAGVVQAQCVSEGTLEQALGKYAHLYLITLRLSETKFTGSGTTDTGNRLFNTTHLA